VADAKRALELVDITELTLMALVDTRLLLLVVVVVVELLLLLLLFLLLLLVHVMPVEGAAVMDVLTSREMENLDASR
jgi:hypothetical protein